VKCECEFKGVNRVESEAFAEQRRVGFDRGRVNILKGEGLDNDLFDAVG
jgi:hypothetical protein